MDELQTLVEEKYKDQFITVSNPMIRARETTTLLESKIEALAMFYMNKDVKQRIKKDSVGAEYRVDYVKISVKEIAELIPRKYNDYMSGTIYERIRNIAISMKQKIFIIEDKEQKKFLLKNMYGDIAYSNGDLYIEFEPSMKKYFLGLKQNFSKLKLPILFSFKKNGGFQLYKLLKSYAYPPNLPELNISLSQEELPIFEIYWNLTDLRMQMGYIDLSQPLLKKEASKDHPDFAKMENIDLGTKMYHRWNDLNNRIIKPGVEEINKLSDIYIADVKKDVKGHGGKVVGVTFVIQHNKAYYEQKISDKLLVVNTQAELTDEQKDDFIDELMEVFVEKIKLKDLKAIAEAAEYNLEKIRRIYSLAENSNGIDDIVGWMIAGLKKNYSEPVKKQKKDSFNSFNQRKYDYDELEKDVVNT